MRYIHFQFRQGSPRPDSAQPYRLRLPVLSSVSDVDGGAERAARAGHSRRAWQARGKKAREALSKVGLEQKADTLPMELSGGEQQRVAIARAFVANPSIILADEPTAALDGDNGRTIMRILADAAHERQRAVLVVTHDPRIVPFADRIVEIEDGRLVNEESGGPERLRMPKAVAFRP
ncbi:ATP-binding cassette domain-containing protein [Bradyrhizobium sp. ISRA463]|uniref:ABC transporter ATP-binding protein n=1 Tax=Bradyrhizobium sp. ISRA463 TaxID=2866199 RepID=UPI0032B06115